MSGGADAGAALRPVLRGGRSRADFELLDAAGNDIFELNAPIVGLVGRLVAAGHRLGVCSNTTPSHWGHCTSRFGMLTTMFSVYAMSYRLRAMKPDPSFYPRPRSSPACSRCDFFYHDRADNVAAANEAGWDAVVYEIVSPSSTRRLRSRGVLLNY